MMDFLKENKGLSLVIGAAVLGTFAYFIFFAGDDSAQLLTETTATSTSQVSRELLETLADLRSIKLDNSIFDDQAFLSLVDFRVDIPLQPVGRDNPFAPLRGGTRAVSPTQSSPIR